MPRPLSEKSFLILFTLAWFLAWPALWMYHIVAAEFDLTVVILVGLAGLVCPTIVVRWSRPARRFLSALARRRNAAALSAGLFVLVVRAALLPIFPPPIPLIQDEASYLLAADTLAMGRLANPSHLMWEHLEALHVNHVSQYVSKYPPGQGLVLAVGQLLGHPWIGVLLSVSLMTASICWMLQGWLPPAWALYGAFLIAIRISITSYWMDSYWGGAVAAIGGALVFGSYPRLRAGMQARHAFGLGLGLLILSQTRPFEGLILTVPLGVMLAVWICQKYLLHPATALKKVILPLAALSIISVGFIAFYNKATTGNALQAPYMEYENAYLPTPLMLWQPLRDIPLYRHEIHRKVFIDFAVSEYDKLRHSYLFTRATRYMEAVNFFIGPLLTLPLMMMPWVVAQRRVRLLVVCFSLLFIVLSMTVFFQEHYWAPVLCIVWVCVIHSIRHLATTQVRGRRTGMAIVILIPVGAVFSLLWCLHERLEATPYNTVYKHTARCKMPETIYPMYQREVVRKRLEQEAGRHLVIVRYGPDHSAHQDWVYNRADIDASKIVWAYDMGVERNKELIEYYSDRTVWLAEPDVEPYRLSRYLPDALPVAE